MLKFLRLLFAARLELVTTIFVDTRLWKTKHLGKHFQNFCQSFVLLTDQIEIHQLQPLVWPSNLLYVMLLGCDWWISIWSVNNMQDWRKFWKRFRGCFVFQSRVSMKMVVTRDASLPWKPKQEQRRTEHNGQYWAFNDPGIDHHAFCMSVLFCVTWLWGFCCSLCSQFAMYRGQNWVSKVTWHVYRYLLVDLSRWPKL